MIYVCALCLWTNWLFWRAGRGVVEHDITVSSVAKRRAGATVFGLLLDEMRSASRVWAVNHAVRAVTTVVMAEAWLQQAQDSEFPKLRAYGYAVTTAFFLIVLATAAAPGFVLRDD
jgi:hypothetical protein